MNQSSTRENNADCRRCMGQLGTVWRLYTRLEEEKKRKIENGRHLAKGAPNPHNTFLDGCARLPSSKPFHQPRRPLLSLSSSFFFSHWFISNAIFKFSSFGYSLCLELGNLLWLRIEVPLFCAFLFLCSKAH